MAACHLLFTIVNYFNRLSERRAAALGATEAAPGMRPRSRPPPQVWVWLIAIRSFELGQALSIKTLHIHCHRKNCCVTFFSPPFCFCLFTWQTGKLSRQTSTTAQFSQHAAGVFVSSGACKWLLICMPSSRLALCPLMLSHGPNTLTHSRPSVCRRREMNVSSGLFSLLHVDEDEEEISENETPKVKKKKKAKKSRESKGSKRRSRREVRIYTFIYMCVCHLQRLYPLRNMFLIPLPVQDHWQMIKNPDLIKFFCTSYCKKCNCVQKLLRLLYHKHKIQPVRVI